VSCIFAYTVCLFVLRGDNNSMSDDKVYSALIIDSDDKNLDVLSDYLEAAGLSVMTVPDGESALDVLGNTDYNFDVVFLDWAMVGISGLAVTQQVRSDARIKDLPIIMQTNKASDQERLKCSEAGADFYLSKPFDEGTFLAALESTIPSASLG